MALVLLMSGSYESGDFGFGGVNHCASKFGHAATDFYNVGSRAFLWNPENGRHSNGFYPYFSASYTWSIDRGYYPDDPDPEWTVGFACRTSGISSVGASDPIEWNFFGLNGDSVNAQTGGNPTRHLTLQLYSPYHSLGGSGRANLRIYRGTPGPGGAGAVLIADLADVLSVGNSLDDWHYIEVMARLSGHLEVHVDEKERFNANVTVNNGGTDLNFDGGWIGGMVLDDMYLLNGKPGMTGFQGDCRVVGALANAAGASTQWTAIGGPNWDAVNTYNVYGDPLDNNWVSASADDALDLYNFTDSPTPSNRYQPRAVQVSVRTLKQDSGSRSVAIVAKSGANQSQSADLPLTRTLSELQAVWETQPGGSPWDATSLDAAQFGMKARP